MKATRKRRVYSYRVAVYRLEVDVDLADPLKTLITEIFGQTLSYDPSSEVATLLNVKPAAKPAKEGKKA